MRLLVVGGGNAAQTYAASASLQRIPVVMLSMREAEVRAYPFFVPKQLRCAAIVYLLCRI
jgi:hypothetical protein